VQLCGKKQSHKINDGMEGEWFEKAFGLGDGRGIMWNSLTKQHMWVARGIHCWV
jgi:hypothetical protein